MMTELVCFCYILEGSKIKIYFVISYLHYTVNEANHLFLYSGLQRCLLPKIKNHLYQKPCFPTHLNSMKDWATTII